MPTIALSYRRSDSSAISGRIYDRLTAHYGEHSVFMDVDNIPFGTDFRAHIRETLQRSDILIAVIGTKWLGAHADGTSRMQEKTDPVRVEIETALERKIPILPILVDGAKMPEYAELPPEFGSFAYLNAAEVVTGRDFRSHMERLIGAIDQLATGNPAGATPQLITKTLQSRTSNAGRSKTWLDDATRYFAAPLILMLIAHHLIVNAYDLDVRYLQAVCTMIPLVFGAAFFLLSSRNAIVATSFAVALGIVSDAAMTVSQSFYSGDPIMPQTRGEWWDNIDYAALIAISYVAGHLTAHALGKMLGKKLPHS
jgi:TIR domain